MDNKKRVSLIGLIISILLFIVGVGVTFAAYTYTRQGTVNSKQLVGDIYMHYTESNTLTLENAMPRENYIENKYFEFTIDGKNTNTKYDIWYDINLLRGDVPTGKTEQNRILDKFLKFRLVEVINNEETEIFTNKSYSDLSSGKRVHVETIPKNTTTGVIHTYRLYMWISNKVVIGNAYDDDLDYDMTTWNNLFASIKVSSTGDFHEKDLATDASCFTTELTYVNATLNTNMTQEELQACVNYLTASWGEEQEGNTVDTGETYQAFCNGTGTRWGLTFQEDLDNYYTNSGDLIYLYRNNIIDADVNNIITNYDENCGDEVIIPSSLPAISRYMLNSNMTSEELQACIDYTSGWSRGWDTGETPVSFCNGSGTNWGFTFQEILDYYWFEQDKLVYFQEHNIISGTISDKKYPVTTIRDEAFAYNQLTSVVIPNSVTFIGAYAFRNNQLTSVVIPNSVTTISNNAFLHNQLTSVEIPNNITTVSSYAFSNNQLTSVVIPNSVTTIEVGAFNSNQLTSVVIPNSVTTIGDSAFTSNQITSIEIPNSVTTIGSSAFSNNQLTSVTIPNSVTTIGEDAFGTNQLTSVTIGNGITSISCGAFNKTVYSNPNLSSITINKSCNDIKNNLLSNSTNYYPWLFQRSPYTGIGGVTIYGSNNEVCDVF